MINKEEYDLVRAQSLQYLERAGIVLTTNEIEHMEVADFGLSRVHEFGLQLVVYVNTERCCAKELVLLPRQTCPQHLHPPVEDSPGKEETFRCRFGTVYLYVPGKRTPEPHALLATDQEKYFTVWREIVLQPGEQYTLQPNTLHWFQAGDNGAVVSEFSTNSSDENDLFTDPNIERITKVEN